MKRSKKDFECLKLTFLSKEVYYPATVKQTDTVRRTACALRCKVNFEAFADRFGLTEQEIKKHLPYLKTASMALTGNAITPMDYEFEAIGWASCMPGDVFCKKTGVMLAESRAKQKAYRVARDITNKLHTMALKRAAGFSSFVRDMHKYETEEKCHELFILERISKDEIEGVFEVK